MLILLTIVIIVICLIPLSSAKNIIYDKKHGLKHTFTDTSITTEWDFQSPLTLLKLLSLFIQSEDDTKQRNKYIRQYTRLKNCLEKDGYDLSDFNDYGRNNE